jgi:hypothetical protein
MSNVPRNVTRGVAVFCRNRNIPGATATKFCIILANIWASLMWNLLHIVFLASGMLRGLLDFWKICLPLPWKWFVSIWSVYRRFTKYSVVLERENNDRNIWFWVEVAEI